MIKFVIALLIIIALLGSFSSYFFVKSEMQAKITEAEVKMANLKNERQQVEDKVAEIERQKAELQAQIAHLTAERDSLKAVVDSLETQRQREEAALDDLFAVDDLAQKMQETFPELGDEPLGTIELCYNDETNTYGTCSPDDFGIEYFVFPVQFVATFIDNAQQAQNLAQQNEALRKIESNLERNLTLSDQITLLTEQKAKAYQEGYEKAYLQYQQLNQEYISVLKQPPTVKFGLPSWQFGVVTGVLGFAGGVILAK
ncbi:MAG: hypothetical protein D6675_13715 [Gemmatimonadetes bacterium]|nr:MAG: hypothetical protein D6675_13715 [Gemmatimonadota bacterium]